MKPPKSQLLLTDAVCGARQPPQPTKKDFKGRLAPNRCIALKARGQAGTDNCDLKVPVA